LYVLLMAALLHDVGMGYSPEELEKRKPPGYEAYIEAHPAESARDYIRMNHHDLGAIFVLDNWTDCLIPDEAFAAAIAEVGRGHRKTDLMDRKLYPVDLKLGGGTVNMAYLAAVIRLADELDVSAARNLMLQYAGFVPENQISAMEFQKHRLLSSDFSGEKVVIKGETNSTQVYQELTVMCGKVQDTLDYCQSVVSACAGTLLPAHYISNEIKFIGTDVSLTLEDDHNGDTLTISLIGKLDTTTAELLDGKLANTLSGGIKNLVLDFGSLHYVSSAGLRIILGAKKKTMALAGDMTIKNISPDVMSVFQMTGFDAIFGLGDGV
jgi:anti-anti-sigma factor